MKYLCDSVAVNLEAPVNLVELTKNKRLKYLFGKTTELTSGNGKIHFILSDDYDCFSAYIPVFILLNSRAENLKNDYGVTPSVLDSKKAVEGVKWSTELWESNSIILVNSIKILDGKTIQYPPLRLDNLTLSLLPRFKKKSFVFNYLDNQSVVLFTHSTSQAEALLRKCLINEIRSDRLFKKCKVDFNNAWDGQSGLVLTRPDLFNYPELFGIIADEKPVKAIVLTYEVLEQLFKQIETNDRKKESKLERLWADVTAFADLIGQPNIILSAPAEKSIILNKHIEYISKSTTELNGYKLGLSDCILEGDFETGLEQSNLIKCALKYQDTDNTIYNFYENIETYFELLLGELEQEFECKKKLRKLFKVLKEELFSIVPLRRSIDRFTRDFISFLSSLSLPLHVKEVVDELSNELFYLNEYVQNNNAEEQYINSLNFIGNERGLILTDNERDLTKESLIRNRYSDTSIKLFSWEKLKDALNDSEILVLSISILYNGSIRYNVYDQLFALILKHYRNSCKIFLLMSKDDILVFKDLIIAFQDSIENIRSIQDQHYIAKPVINPFDFEKQVDLAKHKTFVDINSLLKNELVRYTSRNLGVKPSSIKRNGMEAGKVIIHFEEDDSMVEVPAGRYYFLYKNTSVVSYDEDDDNYKKCAEDLEPGDKIIIIFDDRGSTYQEIRDLLIERNIKSFRDKFNKAQVWINVISDFKTKFGSMTLRSKLIEFEMQPVVSATINNWINDRNVLPDNFENVVSAVKKLIMDYQHLFEGKHHLIGDIGSYVENYLNVYRTPRLLYKSILKKVVNNENIDYSIREYRDIFNELSEKTRILTVKSVE